MYVDRIGNALHRTGLLEGRKTVRTAGTYTTVQKVPTRLATRRGCWQNGSRCASFPATHAVHHKQQHDDDAGENEDGKVLGVNGSCGFLNSVPKVLHEVTLLSCGAHTLIYMGISNISKFGN